MGMFHPVIILRRLSRKIPYVQLYDAYHLMSQSIQGRFSLKASITYNRFRKASPKAMIAIA
jgi:hypothetical protein